MKIVPGSKWEVAQCYQGDLEALLADGWEPYAATAHGGAIRHFLRRKHINNNQRKP